MSYEKKPTCNIHRVNNIYMQAYNIESDKLEYITRYLNGKIKKRPIQNVKTEEIISKENFDENGTKIINNPITIKPLILSPYSHIKDDKKPKDTHVNLKDIHIPYGNNSSVKYYFDDSRKLERIEFIDNNKITSEIILQHPCEVNIFELLSYNIVEKTLKLIEQGKIKQLTGYNDDGTKHIELFYRTDGSTLEKVKFYSYCENITKTDEFILKEDSKLTKDSLPESQPVKLLEVLQDNSKDKIETTISTTLNKDNNSYIKKIQQIKNNKKITYIIKDSSEEYEITKQTDDKEKTYTFEKNDNQYIYKSKLVVNNKREGILDTAYKTKEQQEKILNKYKELEKEFDNILKTKAEKQVIN